MAWYAVAWSEKAPVATVYERAILTLMAHRAKKDGTDAYPPTKNIMEYALCDRRTVQRHIDTMIERGLIAYGNQDIVAHIRADRRPTVYDLLIPHDWFSDDQRAEVDDDRAERGLDPLTAEQRPRLTSPPKKTQRSDKGKANPKRGPKGAATSEEDSGESTGCLSAAPSEPVDNSERGVSVPPRNGERGVSQTPGRGVSVPPNTVLGDTSPTDTSPSPWHGESPHAGETKQGQGETPPGKPNTDELTWRRHLDTAGSWIVDKLQPKVPTELWNTMSRDDRAAIWHLVAHARLLKVANSTVYERLVDFAGIKYLGPTWRHRLADIVAAADAEAAQQDRLKKGRPACTRCNARAGAGPLERVVSTDPNDPSSREVPCPECRPDGQETTEAS